MASTEPVPKRPGRPRSEDADARILAAALELYGERGWYGVTMHGISQRAQVGKSSLYTRWSNVGDILDEAFRVHFPPLEGEFDNIRDLLIAEGRRQVAAQAPEFRNAVTRLATEGSVGPERLQSIYAVVYSERNRWLRRQIADAVQRGQLPERASATRMLDVLDGAIHMHIVSTPTDLEERMRAGLDDYVTDLAEEVIHMTWWRYTGDPCPPAAEAQQPATQE